MALMFSRPRLVQGIKRGIFSAEDLQRREQKALKSLRSFDQGQETAAKTLTAVMDYHRFLVQGESEDVARQERELAKVKELVGRTLQDAPWKQCDCDVCRNVGVEVIIFRSSNRNKRRGFHNLGVYHKHLKATMENAQ